MLARAITLIESKRADHQNKAHQLVQELLPDTGKAIRVGITGAPGVGKSLTIDTLGTHLTGQGHKVAVLAVDPSSTRTGGSILGDKTRMARLAIDDNAFVRPSPSSGTLGGVAAKTRETMLLCEAAGFDVVLVETVGIGQSETTVADMTDFFLALMLPGAGDELQGIKKGLVELADMIAVNKADGDNVKRASTAAAEYRARAAHPHPALAGLDAAGADLFGADRQRHRRTVGAGAAAPRAHDADRASTPQRRREQQVKWMWSMLEERLFSRLKSDANVRARLPAIEAAVAEGRLAATLAVERDRGNARNLADSVCWPVPFSPNAKELTSRVRAD